MAKSFIFGAIAALCIIQGVMCDFPNPTKFFEDSLKDKNSEISRLVWRHGVNVEDDFRKALQNTSIHLLEVDVIKAVTYEEGPLINHDPNKPSKFTLKKLLDLLKDQKKGIKFDFKERTALTESIPLITGANLKVPVYINADILQGPGGGPSEYNPATFVNESMKLTGCVLSAGWTTGDKNDSYTNEHIAEMQTAVGNFPGLKTYPVRASLIQNTNTTVFSPLLDTAGNNETTLTIWTADKDVFDVSRVKNFVETIGRNRVYLDLPEDIQQQINGSTSIAINSFMILGAIFSYFMMMF